MPQSCTISSVVPGHVVDSRITIRPGRRTEAMPVAAEATDYTVAREGTETIRWPQGERAKTRQKLVILAEETMLASWIQNVRAG